MAVPNDHEEDVFISDMVASYNLAPWLGASDLQKKGCGVQWSIMSHYSKFAEIYLLFGQRLIKLSCLIPLIPQQW